jgi:hypothetical protein
MHRLEEKSSASVGDRTPVVQSVLYIYTLYIILSYPSSLISLIASFIFPQANLQIAIAAHGWLLYKDLLLEIISTITPYVLQTGCETLCMYPVWNVALDMT